MNPQHEPVPAGHHHAPAAPITTPVTASLVRGALDLEHGQYGLLPHRLPAWARAQIPDQHLGLAEARPAGVRLAFRTRATTLELDAHRTTTRYAGMADLALPEGVYDLVVDGGLTARGVLSGGDVLTLDPTTGDTSTVPGPVGTVRFTDLPDRVKDVEIWLPHTEITQLVALRSDAPLDASPGQGRRVWLHHGSSISHGSNAASPTSTWPAVAASLGGVDLVNLGFGGGALLDPFTARSMRDTPADLISVKIGINLVNVDLMRLRAFTPAVDGFLDTLREGHPGIPLLVISPLLCPLHEDTPGPLVPDSSSGTLAFRALGDPAERTAGKLTLTVIRDELARVVSRRAAQDPHLHYLDGLDLYGRGDAEDLPLPDGLHPDTATHHRIGERFAARVFGARGPFAAAG
ncbi:lipase [Actinoalloteichus sp. AHMU CJ021]|uniref:GDSL-type esterase/lipase family protein n=1 Tax=Actinoalloteichus sp. AHMU CJ021 TaxID=2072503 RepID=UPI000CA065B9|nr:lipase [Actinoalloteichus sp. AHMU CJ021]